MISFFSCKTNTWRRAASENIFDINWPLLRTFPLDKRLSCLRIFHNIFKATVNGKNHTCKRQREKTEKLENWTVSKQKKIVGWIQRFCHHFIHKLWWLIIRSFQLVKKSKSKLILFHSSDKIYVQTKTSLSLLRKKSLLFLTFVIIGHLYLRFSQDTKTV